MPLMVRFWGPEVKCPFSMVSMPDPHPFPSIRPTLAKQRASVRRRGLYHALEGRQGLLADMVLDTFGIALRRLRAHTDGAQEADDHGVALLAALGHRAPRDGQEDGSVGLARHQAVALEP